MARAQRFIQSPSAAKDLINKARSLRQERIFRKGAAEHAVHQCDLELGYYGSECEEATWARILSKMQHHQRELDEAIDRLARGDQDYGVVTGLLDQAGYPPFPLETSTIPISNLCLR